MNDTLSHRQAKDFTALPRPASAASLDRPSGSAPNLLFPSSHVPKPAPLCEAARRAVFESCDWFTAADVAEALGVDFADIEAEMSRLRASSLIFSVDHYGVNYYPGYALNVPRGVLVESIAPVIAALAGCKDGWMLAHWFASPNDLLGGARPQEVLVSSANWVISAAVTEAMRANLG